MKILLVTQYFWPENFRINDLVLGLQERNCEIIVLSGKPNYPFGKFFEGYSFWKKNVEYWNGIKIYRAPLISRGNGGGIRLFLNYLSFAFLGSVRSIAIKEQVDRIFVYEPSPITVGIPAILLKRRKKVPLFFWVQDLWPTSVSAAGKMNNKWIIRMLDALTKWIYKNSDVILVQSKSFKEYITKQGICDEKIVYYPNSTEKYYQIIHRENVPEIGQELPGGFNVMFAGNLGEAQDLDKMIEAAALVKNKGIPVNWIIIGDGRRRVALEEKATQLNLNNIYFLGQHPSEKMPAYFAYADALLVSLRKDFIFSLTIPSKLQSYLACGKPIIAALDGEGSIIVEESEAGFSGPSGNASAMADNVISLYNMPASDRDQMGEKGRIYFEKNFERELLLTKLLTLLNKPS
jgi:glycosyltransferase involved in cell wall biosynthesis